MLIGNVAKFVILVLRFDKRKKLRKNHLINTKSTGAHMNGRDINPQRASL
jgi:hypothetical protein